MNILREHLHTDSAAAAWNASTAQATGADPLEREAALSRIAQRAERRVCRHGERRLGAQGVQDRERPGRGAPSRTANGRIRTEAAQAVSRGISLKVCATLLAKKALFISPAKSAPRRNGPEAAEDLFKRKEV